MPATEERIDRLEITLQNFIQSVGIEFNKAYNSNEEFKREMKDFKNEMKDFKDEMKDFKNEMKEFKDEMKDFKDEMKDFKDEMKDFKDEMKDFKDDMKEFKNEMKEFKNEMKDFIDEMKLNTKDLNKKFGEMSRKLGTIVEDLVLPSMPRIIQEKFGFELEEFSINIKLKKEGRNQEFDAVGIYKDFVFLNSTKTTVRERDVLQLKQHIQDFPFWFPIHKGKKIYGILAGFDISESIVAYCEKEDFLIMGIGGDLMELLNSKNFMPEGSLIS